MRTSSRFFRLHIGLLMFAGLHAANWLLAAATPNGVTESWEARLTGTGASYFEAAGISAGSAGDVFVAGHARMFGFNYDLLVSHYGSNGARLWQKTYEPAEGPAADEHASAIVARGTNVYVAGSITSASPTGSQDFLTLKYRDSGELEWARRLDGTGHFTDLAVALAVDALGNVLVVGDSIGTNGGFNMVVFKYAPNGDLLWNYSYDGPDHGSDRAAGIRLGADGSIHVAGTSTDASGAASAVTLKLDVDGQEQWVAREVATALYGGGARGLDVDSSGNVVTAGNQKSYCVTWKYDANGNRQWMASYRAEEPATMIAADVRFDGSGNIITAANLYGSATNDAVLIKYAADGQQLWATRIADGNGVAHLRGLGLDAGGNAYLAATPVSDMITVKVGTNGVQLWTATYNSEGFFTDYAEFLQVSPIGDVFVGGRSIFYSDSFVSLVKYAQQSVTGIPTAVVTPALQVVEPGTNILFTAQTSGPGPIQFQWRKNGRAIPDATGATLAVTDVQGFDRGDYSVVVSNPAGATVSPEARLSVLAPPEVAIAPTQTVAYLGTDASFLATVSGNDFVTLQWRHNGTNIAGATNEFLELTNLNGAAAGSYDVVVSSLGGTTTSSAAGLRISGAIELVGISHPENGLRFRVLTNGAFLLAGQSNHLTRGPIIVLHKHDPDGALLWSSAFDSPDFTNAEPTHLALDAAGNIYVSGLSRPTYYASALVVLKYSPVGQLLWSRIVTETNVWVSSFALDASGNSTLGMLGFQGLKVVRYNAAGDLQWFYDGSSPDNDTIAVAVDSSGNSYLGTTIRVNNGSDSEIRLRKFDSTGSNVWTRAYADGMYNRLGEIAVDSADNLIVSGTGELPEVPDSRMFVQKYSPSGQKLWETRTGSSFLEINYVLALAIGPGDEITVLARSDDDYIVEQADLTRISSDGQLKYRIGEPAILPSTPANLALDHFGNAYITGFGNAVAAKYDAYGNRLWMVANGVRSWDVGLALGADAAGDIRVLVAEYDGSNLRVLHYRQRDPAGIFRVRLIPGAAGTFHLGVPAGESFQIEASTDLQNWSVLGAAERDQLLQPGGTAFSGSPRRFFRLIFPE